MAEHKPSDPAHRQGAEEVAHGPVMHREDLRVDHQMETEHHEHDHGGLSKYIYVFLALCVLTGASFFTYSPYWPFRDEPRSGLGVYDGCFVHEGHARHPVLHAREVRGELEVRADDTRGHDVDFPDGDAGSRRRPAAGLVL